MLRSALSSASRRSASLPRPSSPSIRSLSSARPPPPEPQVTTLPNGLRVATEATPGHFTATGVYVDAGSRYESEETRGCSHMVDRMAFKSTRNHTLDSMTSTTSLLGGQFLSSSSRESIIYQSTSYSHTLPLTLSLLSETILHPNLMQSELDAQKPGILYELSEIKNKPEMWIPELIHETAWNGNTLGNELLCGEERVMEMDVGRIRRFMETWFRPERMVLAGVGVKHEEMLELAEKHFLKDWPKRETISELSSSLGSASTSSSSSSTSNGSRQQVPPHLLPQSPSSSPSKPSLFKNLSTFTSSLASVSPDILTSSSSTPPPPTYEELANARARYTGGILFHPNPSLEFTHLHLAFQSPSIHSPDIYPLAVLQILLGGGGSFSAGGPGKGMYTRLYTNVLNRYHEVDHCSSFHHCYNDSGIFGISISVVKGFEGKAMEVLSEQLDSICGPDGTRVMTTGRRGLVGRYSGSKGISEEEAQRAKNMLKSSLVMALESRMVQCEDLGRQIQVNSRKIPVTEMCSKIDSVTVADLYRVANAVLRPQSSPPLLDKDGKEMERMSGRPTIVAMGELDKLGDVEGVLRRYGLGTTEAAA